MKTECVIRSGYFRANRRYAQWITKQEGIPKEILDIKGLEFQKTNFPSIFKDFFKEIVVDTLKGIDSDKLISRIKDFKKEIINGKISLTQLGNPTSINHLRKVYTVTDNGVKKEKGYILSDPKAGEIFTQLKKGVPAPVRAAARYNDLHRAFQIDVNKYPLMTYADKIRWIYLKDNPYKIEALAFFDTGLPSKIEKFLNKYADRGRVFDTILLNKLEGFFDDLEIDLNLNPYLDQFKTFEI